MGRIYFNNKILLDGGKVLHLPDPRDTIIVVRTPYEADGKTYRYFLEGLAYQNYYDTYTGYTWAAKKSGIPCQFSYCANGTWANGGNATYIDFSTISGITEIIGFFEVNDYYTNSIKTSNIPPTTINNGKMYAIKNF